MAKYSIEVQSDGKTHFHGTPNPEADGDTDPLQQDFIMSAANRQKIFDLAQSSTISEAISTGTSSAWLKPEEDSGVQVGTVQGSTL